jgi:hypothetical protein
VLGPARPISFGSFGKQDPSKNIGPATSRTQYYNVFFFSSIFFSQRVKRKYYYYIILIVIFIINKFKGKKIITIEEKP